MNRLRLLVLPALVAVLLSIPAVAHSALQADADEVADAVADRGYFVDPATGVDEARTSDLVSAIRSEGEAVSLVVMSVEPPGGSTTFAGAVFDRLGRGVVVVVGSQTVGWEGIPEVFDVDAIDGALDASLDGTSDMETLELFAAGLLGEGVPDISGEPATPGETGAAPAPSDGGSSAGIWILLGLVALAVVGFVVLSRRNRSKGPRVSPELAEARTRVQAQIDAVANDIIDLEDEVRTSDNAEVGEHFRTANEAYSAAHEQFAAATTPQALLDLSNSLDRAIWNLDAAEAILDGKPVPEEPTPQTLPEPTPAEPSPQPPPPQTYPTYDRRPGRRSTYGGGGLTDALSSMAMMAMASRVVRSSPRRSSRPAPTGGTSRSRSGGGGARRSAAPRSSGGRARGGGRRRGR